MLWSADFAYVVGLITTDGNLSSDGRHLSIVSKDLEQIQHFAAILKLKNKIGISLSGSKRAYFRIQFGNMKLYRFLLSIGLCPNKSKVLKEIFVPDNYFADFLRGCLDGDGFSYSYWDKRWKSSFMLYSGFVSASKPFLEWMLKTIATLYGIHGKIRAAGTAYQLVFAKKASLQLIEKMYYSDQNVYLSRKKWKIDAALSIIAQHARVAKLATALS